VLITAMTSMASANGALRILPSGKIPHPVGDPTRSQEEEVVWRTTVVRHAAEALAEPLDEARVFA
jgi:glycine reductase